MPIHSLATVLEGVDGSSIILSAATLLGVVSLKAWSGGRRCTWEREWAGKMILIVAPPTPTILSLIHHLLNLPSPPQILYLPPYPSPLPQPLLTILHTLRLSTRNPQAQLHCEPLPPTPNSIKQFTTSWSKVPTGMSGEGGRRIDAIILGSGWEINPLPTPTFIDPSIDPNWSTHQFHFHLLTSLLPHLIRQPPERNIRIITLLSPTYPTALPTLQGKVPKKGSRIQESGMEGIKTLLLMRHFQLILDTLASAAYSSVKPVPKVSVEEGEVKTNTKKREEGLKSNIMGVSVVMPWARNEVLQGAWGVRDSWFWWFLYMLCYPVIMLFTPSPARAIHSILFALQAPVRYGDVDSRIQAPTMAGDGKTDDVKDPRRNGVGGGDVVRDCAVIDLPPVLLDPTLARTAYDILEKEVEQGVRESETRARAFPAPVPMPAQTADEETT